MRVVGIKNFGIGARTSGQSKTPKGALLSKGGIVLQACRLVDKRTIVDWLGQEDV